MPPRATPLTTPPQRARLAAWLGVLAVFCALFAPVSMLAQDVQSGKLSGICSASYGFDHGDAGSTPGDQGNKSAGCELCGFIGLILPGAPLTVALRFAPPPPQALKRTRPLSAAVPGLPFSRGPPVFLI